MTIGGSNMNDYGKAKQSIEVSVGESVKILRELQELSQNDLAKASGIPQSTISAIENDRVQIGVERAKILASIYSDTLKNSDQTNKERKEP
jgi:transcriptional regulator with XRE-family HTH domain